MTLSPRLVKPIEFERRQRIADMDGGMGTVYVNQTGQVELAAGPTVIQELREFVVGGCYTVNVEWTFDTGQPPLVGKAVFWRDDLYD